MKLSWSHKLFLRINSQIGERRWLGLFMVFCAKWLIFIESVLFFILLYQNSFYSDFGVLRIFAGNLISVLVLLAGSYLASVCVGFLWRRLRPDAELPQVKTLVKTAATWKSFPSDHALISSLLALLSIALFIQDFVFIVFPAAALLVAAGRVYVGVHYPRDIIGGWILALLSFSVFYFLL